MQVQRTTLPVYLLLRNSARSSLSAKRFPSALLMTVTMALAPSMPLRVRAAWPTLRTVRVAYTGSMWLEVRRTKYGWSPGRVTEKKQGTEERLKKSVTRKKVKR